MGRVIGATGLTLYKLLLKASKPINLSSEIAA